MIDLGVVSHWSHLVEGLSYSSQEFYASLDQAVARWHVPDVKVSRVALAEGGIFSGKRDYFRVGRKDYLFDCCAAPFGSGFFVSWWLLKKLTIWEVLGALPFVGWMIRLFVKPVTYYTHDTAVMFQSAIDHAVKHTLDGICTAKGCRLPSELERKPVMREFYERK